MNALDKHLANAVIVEEPESVETDRTPQITAAQVKDNYRRLKYPVLITEHADGTRSFKHDIVNRQSDGLIPSVSTDRGAHAVIARGVDGYGAETRPSSGPSRDEHGRFVKGGGRDRA